MALWSRVSAIFLSAAVILRVSSLIRRLGQSACITNGLIENLLDGILIIDARTRIIHINREAGLILKLDPGRVRGKLLSEAVTRWQPILQQLLHNQLEHPLSEFHQAGQSYELYTAPCPGGQLIVIRNITTYQQMEETARRDRELAEERANRLEIIKNLAETLNQTLPPEKALEAGLEMVANQVGAQAGWFLTLTPENKAVLSAGYRIPEYMDLARHREYHWPLCACLRAAQDGLLIEPIRVFDCERLMRTQNLNENAIKHHLSIPVRASGKPVGILNLIVPADREFDESEIRMLALYGDQFGGAIERVRLFAEVHKMAITDPLTELYNRRHFFELAEREFERVRRYEHPMSVAMLDVDHFKHINDTYGHQAGDQVLQTLARISADEIRRNDILGRYGGEELIILMPETSHDNAMMAMERLRKTIEQAEITTQRGILSTTISIGMASKLPEETVDLQKLIDQADQALYAAKLAGRNRVCTWEIHPA